MLSLLCIMIRIVNRGCVVYYIKKVLNNNAVVVVDIQEKQEIIFMGKGIGFGKKVNHPFEEGPGSKKYILKQATEKGSTEDLLNSVNPIYVEIAGAIIDLSEEAFGDTAIDNNILLPLADHIAFSVVRMQAKMAMHNPFAEDIRLLYEDEYAVALKAKDIIEARTGFFIPDGELGYITLYIHSALCDMGVSQSLKITSIIRESVDRIQEECQIEEIGTIAYNRLLYHIKCMMTRANKNEALNQDMIAFTKEKCAYSFNVAKAICHGLREELGMCFTETEISYLALHIERIRTSPKDD